mgnify:CR=1 FL=1
MGAPLLYEISFSFHLSPFFDLATMLFIFRLPVYGILKVYRKSDANELFNLFEKQKIELI